MTLVVHLEGVRVVAGNRVLLEVPRLAIGPGERVAIVGPNGAGKSTLLKLMGTLVPVQLGRAQVLGRTIGQNIDLEEGGAAGATLNLKPSEHRSLRRHIGLLMQGLHLVPCLTARENVLVGALARLRGMQAWLSWCRWYPPSLVNEADAALDALGLADRAHVRADRLSGGERQKVALARVQLQRPCLLLADEPTSALDPAATRQVCEALLTLTSQPGRTLVTVVHDLELLPMLATRVIGMTEGRLCWDRPMTEVTPTLLQTLYKPRTSQESGITRLEPTIVTPLVRTPTPGPPQALRLINAGRKR